MKVLKMIMLVVLSMSLWTCKDFTFTTTDPAEGNYNFEICFNYEALQKSKEIVITSAPVTVEFSYLFLQIRNAGWQEIYAAQLSEAELGNNIRLHLDDTTIMLHIEVCWLVDGIEQKEQSQCTVSMDGYQRITIDIIPPSGVIVDINEPVLPSQGENISIGVFDNWESALRTVFASDAFRARFPGVTITVKTTDWGNHHARILEQLAAGSGANDIEAVEAAMLAGLVAEGGLTDLAQAPYNGMAACQDLAPFAVSNSTTVDGKLLAIPVDASPVVLYWRKSIADAAHLDFTAVADWQEYIAMAENLTGDTDGDGVVDRYAVTHPIDLALIPLNGGMGGWFMNGAPYAPEQGFKDALALARAVRTAGIDAGFFPWSWAWMDCFRNNTVVTMFGGNKIDEGLRGWMCPELAGDWRIAYPPGNAYASSGGTFLIIPEQTAAGKKALAWEIIKYLCTSPEAQLSNLESINVFPVLTTVYNDPVMDEPAAYYGGQQIRHIFRDICLQIPARRISRYDATATIIFKNAVYAVIDNGVSVDDAYTAAKLEMMAQM